MILIRTCPNCGKQTLDGRFCEHCGAQLVIYPANPPVQLPQKPTAPAKTTGFGTLLLIIILFILGLFFLATVAPFIFVGIASLFDSGTKAGADKIPVSVANDNYAPGKDCAFLVTSDPAGATVTVDGSYRAMTRIKGPVTVLVTAGSHSISLSKDGYYPYSER